MEYYFTKLFRTEITSIPFLLRRLSIGNYFDNAFSNGVFWLFILLYIFHEIIDTVQSYYYYNEKPFFREYLRSRINRANWSFYWYLIGLYIFSFMVIGNGDLQNVKKLPNSNRLFPVKKNKPFSFVFESIFTFSFFFHTAFWDLIKYNDTLSAINNILLSLVVVSQYHFRTIFIFYKIMLVVCLRRSILEYLRLHSIFVISTTSFTYYINYGMFITYFLFSFVIFTYIIPFSIIKPLNQIDFEDNLSLALYGIIILWYIFELIDPVILKMLNYPLNGNDDESLNELNCCDNLIHSAIYPKIDDLVQDLMIREREIKKRRAELMTKRKPKQNRMFIQTIKCMAVLKKKLNSKRFDDLLDVSTLTQICNGGKKTSNQDAAVNWEDLNEKTEATEASSSSYSDEEEEEAVNGKLQIKITTDTETDAQTDLTIVNRQDLKENLGN